MHTFNPSIANEPIFIGGTQRSGTSLLRSLIDSNSEIYFPPAEMKFFVRFHHLLKTYEPLDKKGNLRRFLTDYGCYRKNIKRAGLLDSKEFFEVLSDNMPSWNRILSTIMQALAAEESKVCWGEKSPGNEFFTENILKIYPKAKIICTIRDPRALIASSRRRYNRGFIKPMIRWKMSVRKIIRDFQILSTDVFQIIFYEDMVIDLENTMKKVFDFLHIKPLQPLNMLQLNSAKWGKGGTTSYQEKKSTREGIVWKDSLDAYKDEIGIFELKMIEAFTRNERNLLSYIKKKSRDSSYFLEFSDKIKSSQYNVNYSPSVSRILNRFTDRPLLT